MFEIDVKGHKVKLWQNKDGSWKASYSLDPMGFIFDDQDPTLKIKYELHHLIGHGENKALDLANQIENIKTDGNPNQENISLLSSKITELINSKEINPDFLPIEKALSIEIKKPKIKLNTIPQEEKKIGKIKLNTIKQDDILIQKPEIGKKLIDQNILESLGLNDLPDYEKKDLLTSFCQSVFQAILLKIYNNLNENDKPKFEKIITSGSEESLGLFIKTQVKDIDILTTQEVLRFKKEMINKLKQQNTTIASN